METLAGVAGLIGIINIAFMTPGPNNFIVMSTAAHGGMAATVPAIAGIVTGSCILLTSAWVGSNIIFEIVPILQTLLKAGGILYLVWLGATMIRHAGTPRDDQTKPDDSHWPTTLWGLAAFQFVNPKGWVIVLTAINVVTESLPQETAFVFLIAVFTILPAVWLALWASVGAALSSWLQEENAARRFNIAMGALLIGSAAMLIV